MTLSEQRDGTSTTPTWGFRKSSWISEFWWITKGTFLSTKTILITCHFILLFYINRGAYFICFAYPFFVHISKKIFYPSTSELPSYLQKHKLLVTPRYVQFSEPLQISVSECKAGIERGEEFWFFFLSKIDLKILIKEGSQKSGVVG